MYPPPKKNNKTTRKSSKIQPQLSLELSYKKLTCEKHENNNKEYTQKVTTKHRVRQENNKRKIFYRRLRTKFDPAQSLRPSWLKAQSTLHTHFDRLTRINRRCRKNATRRTVYLLFAGATVCHFGSLVTFSGSVDSEGKVRIEFRRRGRLSIQRPLALFIRARSYTDA